MAAAARGIVIFGYFKVFYFVDLNENSFSGIEFFFFSLWFPFLTLTENNFALIEKKNILQLHIFFPFLISRKCRKENFTSERGKFVREILSIQKRRSHVILVAPFMLHFIEFTAQHFLWVSLWVILIPKILFWWKAGMNKKGLKIAHKYMLMNFYFNT